MKKTLALILALILVSLPFTAFASPAPFEEEAPVRFGGYVMGDFYGPNTNSWVGFDSSDPSSIDVYDSLISTYAAAYHDGFVYGYIYGFDSDGVLHDEFYRANTKNYGVEFIEGASSGGEFVYGMAFNPVDGKMYALCDEDHPYLAEVDLETGVLTRRVDIALGTLLGVQTLAIDGSGEFYALTFSAVSSKLMKINMTSGALTPVLDTGMPCFYGQSMTWDPVTDAIYWAHVNEPSSLTNGLYRIDIAAGSVTYLGMIGSGLEIMGLHTVTDADPVSFIKGDVNLDGSVDSADALLALRHSMGIELLEGAGLAAGDVNEDGSVDSADALMILRFALGIINEL